MGSKVFKVGDKTYLPVRIDELMPYYTAEAFGRLAAEGAERRKNRRSGRAGPTPGREPGAQKARDNGDKGV